MKPNVNIKYIHASDLYNSLSINLAWMTEENGDETPLLEVYVSCGRGPDLTKKFRLSLDDDELGYLPKELRDFGERLIEGANQMEQEMRAVCKECGGHKGRHTVDCPNETLRK